MPDAYYDLPGKLSSCEDLFGVPESLGYEFWTRELDSVRNRRQKFLEWMDFGVDRVSGVKNEEVVCEGNGVVDRIMENCRAVLWDADSSEEFSSSRSYWSDEAIDLAEDGSYKDALVHNAGPLNREREVRQNMVDVKKKMKKVWFSKLSAFGCVTDVQKQIDLIHLNFKPIIGSRIRDVKVHPYKKHFKELSSLLSAQDFLAHQGSILTMKFSPDGRYLASGGEDGVVRVWKVIESERSQRIDMADSDFPCLYSAPNILSKSSLELLDADKGKLHNDGGKKLSSLAHVIVPPKVFSIREKPLYEFKGHCDQVLDLSWSKKGHILSSSVDNTVRLWQVGHNSCLGVFAHSNYVTSVQFNPVNDDCFISGSIDGKVRIWEVLMCQVIDWTDTKEIITAVSYRPDGMGVIVGSVT